MQESIIANAEQFNLNRYVETKKVSSVYPHAFDLNSFKRGASRHLPI